MKWIIAFAVLASLLKVIVSKFTSYVAESISSGTVNSSRSTAESQEDDDSPTSLFDDTSMTSSLIDPGASSLMDDSFTINPANGLPMIGCVDVEGNAYGTDSTHWDDHSISGSSFMDDHFSSGSSMFDDTFPSSSISSFGD